MHCILNCLFKENIRSRLCVKLTRDRRDKYTRNVRKPSITNSVPRKTSTRTVYPNLRNKHMLACRKAEIANRNRQIKKKYRKKEIDSQYDIELRS